MESNNNYLLLILQNYSKDLALAMNKSLFNNNSVNEREVMVKTNQFLKEHELKCPCGNCNTKKYNLENLLLHLNTFPQRTNLLVFK